MFRLWMTLFISWCMAALATPPCWAQTTAPTWLEKPDIAGIETVVPVLKHPAPKGWQTTLFWWQIPLSFDDPTKLKHELDMLGARGLLPCVEVPAEYDDYCCYQATPQALAHAVAQAKTFSNAGISVHLSMKGVFDLYITPGGPRGKVVRHSDAPNTDAKDAIGLPMPCLIMEDGWKVRAQHLRGILQQFVDANIPVAGVWYDYEGHPHPWNGVFEANAACPICRKAYPADVLDDREKFGAWCLQQHADAIAAGLAEPVRQTFPHALTGFYDYVVSSTAHRAWENTGRRAAAFSRNPEQIDVVQPVCYADQRLARGRYNPDWPIPQAEMDSIYFTRLLATASDVHHNLRPNQILMPFVSSFVGHETFKHIPRMSQAMYLEFLRHAMLRGVKGFYVFNVGPPYGAVFDFYQELVDVNIVCNEMFAYGDLFDGGKVLNDAVPNEKDTSSIVWSGLSKGDKALVRIVTMGDPSRNVDLVIFPGKITTLIAAPEGKTYLVDATGQAKAVE
ncbi:MAG: hypothetical protein IT440_10715 [Phycisphaeraceae bacterium]|nr:hypothetical protein [Phycisphaeraceae bacterium]